MFNDINEFITVLEKERMLARITEPVSPDLEIAAITDRDRLPDLLWSTEVAGTVTASASAETGLRAGTPVIAGTIDAASEAMSVGVRADGDRRS